LQLGKNLLFVTVEMEQFIQNKGPSSAQEGKNEKSCDEIAIAFHVGVYHEKQYRTFVRWCK